MYHCFSFDFLAALVYYFFLTSSCQINGQLKSLQIVASLTAERDGDTRKAALNTMATGYKILGQFCIFTISCDDGLSTSNLKFCIYICNIDAK